MIDSTYMKRDIPVERAPRLISPGAIALVTSFHKGDMNVMTAGWITPVSFKPVFIGLNVHQDSLTHELIKKSGEFVLNIPTRDLLRQVRYCGSVSGRDQNKLKVAGLHEEGPQHVKPILIAECIAHIECAVITSITPGDHTQFIAEILCATADDEAFIDNYLLLQKDLSPLHHLGGEVYSSLGEILISDAALPKPSD